ncbi:hypothetical protein ACA040_001245 [Xenophilus aerolatus]
MGRAKRAIEALAALAPDTAMVRRDGQTVEIAVEELVVGDIVQVRPNERLPADGFLVNGSSSINQAPVTGESIPVDKRPVPDAAAARIRPDTVDAVSRAFAGTINGAGAIEIEVTRRSGDSALARVVRMVSEAETRKSPTQRFAFVPLDAHQDLRAGGRVALGVAHQVGDRPPEQPRVHRQHGLATHRQAHARILQGSFLKLRDGPDLLGQALGRAPAGLRAAIGLRQKEHVGDDGGQPSGFLQL